MVDRISKLPDEVLCHILSFLPTKDAVSTMVLSKRWKPLWPSVPSLHFYDVRSGKKPIKNFVHFVYAAILSRSLHQPIKNLSLMCQFTYSDANAKVWLNAAIQRQLENLEIEYCVSEVPSLIFCCKTLVVLKLSWLSIDDFASSVDLPSLNTLYLDEVQCSKFQFFVELLNGSPILENLEAFGLSFVDYSFEGKVKTLSKFVRAELYFYGSFHIPLKALYNVEYLYLHECYEDIPVFPNLNYLELGTKFKWKFAHNMLNHCPKLQTVALNLCFDNGVMPCPRFVPESFSSHFRKCILKDYEGAKRQMRFARYVMQNSTSLRTMEIRSAYQDDQKNLEMITELTSYPRGSATCELLFKKLIC